MKNHQLARLILAGLLFGGLTQVTLEVFAQRRGRSSSRGSISRYGGSPSRGSSYRGSNYQRGSVNNYQSRSSADAWKGYSRYSSQTRQGSSQGPSSQNQLRSSGGSTQTAQQRPQTLGQQGGQTHQSGQAATSQQGGQTRQSGQAAANQGRQTGSETPAARSGESGTQGASTRSAQQGSGEGVPDGSWSRETARGGEIELSKSTQGDTTTINKNITTAEGRTGSSTKTATRDGDTINVEGRQQTGEGATRETSSEIKMDDGRVEEVKREAETTGRYGESIERESEFKRDGNEIEYKGKTETSTGREVETEADIFRTATGGIGAVGEIDSKYWGDYDFAHGRGPRGQGTALSGPYGGALITTLPNGARRVTVYGSPYYYSGYHYYCPYYWGGAYYYSWVYPPYGSYYWSLPPGYTTVYVGSVSYYYQDQVYYQKTYKEGKVAYKVTEAPSGAQVKSLPDGSTTLIAEGTRFSYYGNTFYRQVEQGGQKVYVVVEKPAGLTTISELPADFEPVPLAAVTFFKIEHQYYLPYLDGQEQVFLLVDPPQAPQGTAPLPALPTELTVAAGTAIQIRTADDLNSGKNKKGDSYKGFLHTDLVVDGQTVAPAGSEVYGLLAEVKKAGKLSGKARLELSLIDLLVGDKIYPLSTIALEIDGEKSRTLLKVGVGAGVGAAVGAVADGGEGALIGTAVGAAVGTAVAVATGGKQVKIEAQTLLEFKLDKSVIIEVGTRLAD